MAKYQFSLNSNGYFSKKNDKNPLKKKLLMYLLNEKCLYLMTYTFCGVARGMYCICKIENIPTLLIIYSGILT